MSKFQVTIIDNSCPATSEETESGYQVNQHTNLTDKVVNRIDDLEEVWDNVIDRLTSLASKTTERSSYSEFELKSIEFSIGIEGGLNIGLVTKADAAVTVSFERSAQKSVGEDSPSS